MLRLYKFLPSSSEQMTDIKSITGGCWMSTTTVNLHLNEKPKYDIFLYYLTEILHLRGGAQQPGCLFSSETFQALKGEFIVQC